MNEALLAAYRASDYRVRLRHHRWASIRIDHPLPETLRPLVGTQPWGFITAWNPYSQPTSCFTNRQAQHRLLAALRRQSAILVIRAAVGVGQAGWREPSLFVTGADIGVLDTLMRACRQNAYVHGDGVHLARLRVLAA